jgi:hypothetical protein
MKDWGRFYASWLFGPVTALLAEPHSAVGMCLMGKKPVVDSPVINDCAKRIHHSALGF